VPQVAETSTRQDEEAAIRHVASGLKTSCPSVDAAVVDAAVATAHGEFQPAKIRTFIQILVERRIRIMLSAYGRDGASLAPTAERLRPSQASDLGHDHGERT